MLQTYDLHTYVDDPTGFDWRNHATQSGGDSTKPQSWYMDNAHLRMFVEGESVKCHYQDIQLTSDSS
jgi:hypothetical protein